MRLRATGVSAGVMACLILLSGCGSFFNPKGTSTGSGSGSGGGTGGGTGGAGSIYLANGATQSVSAFSLANGKLGNLNVTGTLGDTPVSLAIHPKNSFVWVGTYNGFIFAYAIHADGSLTQVIGANSYVFNVAGAQISSMVVDPSDRYLLALCNTGTSTAPLVFVLAINSDGSVTQVGSPLTSLDFGSAFQILFAPNGTQAYVALGTGGVDALTFNPGNGSLGKLSLHPNKADVSYADQGLAVDSAGKYLFVAETGFNGVRVLDMANNLKQLGQYPTGLGARSVLVDRTGAYVYVSNSTTTTISQFALSSAGALTPLAAPTITTGSSPYSLAEDSTGKFIISANLGGSPDLEVFSIGGDGTLTSAAKVTGSNGQVTGAVAVVATQ